MNLSRTTVTTAVTKNVLAVLGTGITDVDPDIPLFDLGIPSVLQIVERLDLPGKKHLVLPEINDQTTTINDLVNAICGKPQ